MVIGTRINVVIAPSDISKERCRAFYNKNNCLFMSKLEQRIPQEQTSEIFALAAELQARHEQSYSIEELVKIGAEANIAPEFIEQAAKQIQVKKRREALRETIINNVTNLGAAIVLLSFLTGIFGLQNGHCSSLTKTQPENSQTLPDS